MHAGTHSKKKTSQKGTKDRGEHRRALLPILLKPCPHATPPLPLPVSLLCVEKIRSKGKTKEKEDENPKLQGEEENQRRAERGVLKANVPKPNEK